MSSGRDNPESLVVSSLDGLAPLFAAAIEAALADCAAADLDAIVYESLRSDELQRLYWLRGRPPSEEYPQPVTNAPSAQYGWHFFGLAVDVISASARWDAGDRWNLKVGAIMRSHDLKCGQDWPHPDIPHYQWGGCRRSPSDEARALYAQGGLEAVWAAVGASE